jgi:RNA polymerase sigma-70 factor (ECF subfamily)
MCSAAGARRFDAASVSGLSADALRLVIALCHETPDRPRRADQQDAAEARPDFETVLRLFHKRVYNLAYRILGNSDEAADLTQETFVKAYKAYSGFRGTSQAVYPWLCRIAVNGCKNRFREMGRRSEYEVLSLDEPVETQDSAVQLEIGDESMNPAGVLERRELEAKIQESIQVLPPELRLVVVLRDMQGLSYREIVDATGLTMETVKIRIHRGRGLLRRRLAPYLSV